MSTTASPAEPSYTVHYQSNVWDGRPLADPCTCRHPGTMACPIGSRIERVRGRNVLAYDAIVCLDCGTDGTGQMDLVEGLTAVYQHGMAELIPAFVDRVYDLVEHRRDDLSRHYLPLWMAIPLGITGQQLFDYNRMRRAFAALAYLAERALRSPARLSRAA